MKAPEGLSAGGRALWEGLAEGQDLDAGQLAMLEMACRQRDRADALAVEAAGGDAGAMRHEREASLTMSRLIAAARLPDPVSGKRPQRRQARGVQKPGTVTAADFGRRSG